MTRLLRFFLLLLLIFDHKEASAQDFEVSAFGINDSLSKGVDSVKRGEMVLVDLTDTGSMSYQVKKSLTIFNKRGLRDLDAAVRYNDNIKVKNIEAWVFNALGKEIEHLKKRDFKDRSAVSGGTLYSDDRVMLLDYTPYSYPVTIVFELEYRSKTTAFIPSWEPLSAYLSSTEGSTYTIRYNPTDNLTFKSYNLEGHNIKSTEKKGEITFVAKNLTPISPEYLSPSFYEIEPLVRFGIENFYLEGVSGQGGTWEKFGAWMSTNLLAGTDAIPEKTKQQVLALTADLPDDEAKARAIYQFVQDKVRYISVQVGIGGWKPMNAEDVDRLGYGDCKALSNYTKSLMDLVGVKSYYAVIYGGNDIRSLDADIVSVQGNHVVLALDLDGEEDLTWLECTSQTAPFGHTAGFTDNRNALLVDESGGKLVSTRNYDADANLKTRILELNIADKTNVEGTVHIKSKGLFYDNIQHLERLQNSKLREHYLEVWSSLNGLDIENVNLQNDRVAVLAEEKLKFHIPDYITQVNNDLLLKPNLWGMTRGDIPVRYTSRNLPFVIERGKTYKDTIVIKLPQGMRTQMLPEPVEIVCEFGTYTASNVMSPQGELIYTRVFKLNSGTFPAAKYEAYREFYKKCASHDNQKILITAKS